MHAITECRAEGNYTLWLRFADGLAGAFVDNNGYALGAVMIMPLLMATAEFVGVFRDAAVTLSRYCSVCGL